VGGVGEAALFGYALPTKQPPSICNAPTKRQQCAFDYYSKHILVIAQAPFLSLKFVL
jgi:hypothetical protein